MGSINPTTTTTQDPEEITVLVTGFAVRSMPMCLSVVFDIIA